ncbi:hypothetical protein Sulku_0173 [Sulfuricurvum kujiense DSM 16994]|uniref:Uncharacterized protein n=1 Tax=Sulfuricurvum kujiense (strain ATCC BAA-921 / DSM 16994 / JCM 11577 / YK-1) TaxID=709032 RepID=E4TXE3_SULKY|nr:hypothetical protein [Sulfuricurvum kujiense]ADR32840.1 hypothetical protein Sulku_0173 [Sulfuricurvum kujiense DSM 16994]
MKKYSLLGLFVVILLTILVSTYFYFLDIVYEDKTVAEEVKTFSALKTAVEQPVAVYAEQDVLRTKNDQYDAMLQELGMDAEVKIDQKKLTIQGGIHDTYSYLLLKRLLDVVKNDDVELVSSCIGQGCTGDEFGFSITIRPYVLKIPQ